VGRLLLLLLCWVHTPWLVRVRARVRLVGLCDVSAIVGWLGGMMTTMIMMCRVWACVACLRGRWVGCEMVESHVCGFVLLWFPV
jgi:hypothetical protein